jgi:hypothetical protein
MIYFAALGLCFAVIRGKDIRTLLQVHFDWPFLLIGSFLVQVLLWTMTVSGNPVPTWVFDVTLMGVLVGLWRNRGIPGMWTILIGTCLNFLAVATHGGFMPVSLSAWHESGHTTVQLQDSRHVIASDGGTDWLGDWIPLFRYVLSPGDIVAGVGMVMFIHRNSCKRYVA